MSDWDWGSAFSSGAAGAGAGAALGPWGAAAGGALGMLGGLFGGSDSRREKRAMEKRAMEQRAAVRRAMENRASGLRDMGGNVNARRQTAPARYRDEASARLAMLDPYRRLMEDKYGAEKGEQLRQAGQAGLAAFPVGQRMPGSDLHYIDTSKPYHENQGHLEAGVDPAQRPDLDPDRHRIGPDGKLYQRVPGTNQFRLATGPAPAGVQKRERHQYFNQFPERKAPQLTGRNR